jgi:hypothetical protein
MMMMMMIIQFNSIQFWFIINNNNNNNNNKRKCKRDHTQHFNYSVHKTEKSKILTLHLYLFI